jgi:hypothetical protein
LRSIQVSSTIDCWSQIIDKDWKPTWPDKSCLIPLRLFILKRKKKEERKKEKKLFALATCKKFLPQNMYVGRNVAGSQTCRVTSIIFQALSTSRLSIRIYRTTTKIIVCSVIPFLRTFKQTYKQTFRHIYKQTFVEKEGHTHSNCWWTNRQRFRTYTDTHKYM